MRLLILANRAPIAGKDLEGRPRLAAGGLVSALVPLLGAKPCLWIAERTAGSREPERVPLPFGGGSSALRLVSIPEREYAGYYHGLSNRALWPLFHSLIPTAAFDRSEWKDYVSVNRRFAQ